MKHVDVLVAGAGISGIAAAHYLQEHCPEKTFAILEGRVGDQGTVVPDVGNPVTVGIDHLGSQRIGARLDLEPPDEPRGRQQDPLPRRAYEQQAGVRELTEPPEMEREPRAGRDVGDAFGHDQQGVRLHHRINQRWTEVGLGLQVPGTHALHPGHLADRFAVDLGAGQGLGRGKDGGVLEDRRGQVGAGGAVGRLVAGLDEATQLIGRAIDERYLLLYRTVLVDDQGYRQGRKRGLQ